MAETPKAPKGASLSNATLLAEIDKRIAPLAQAVAAMEKAVREMGARYLIAENGNRIVTETGNPIRTDRHGNS